MIINVTEKAHDNKQQGRRKTMRISNLQKISKENKSVKDNSKGHCNNTDINTFLNNISFTCSLFGLNG